MAPIYGHGNGSQVPGNDVLTLVEKVGTVDEGEVDTEKKDGLVYGRGGRRLGNKSE